MSNLTPELCEGINQEVVKPFLATEQLGSVAVVQLTDELTFADIFAGKVPIDADTTIYDRSGAQIDTIDLLTHVDVNIAGIQ